VEIVLCIFSRGISNVKNIFCVSQIMSKEGELEKRLAIVEKTKRQSEAKLVMCNTDLERKTTDLNTALLNKTEIEEEIAKETPKKPPNEAVEKMEIAINDKRNEYTQLEHNLTEANSLLNVANTQVKDAKNKSSTLLQTLLSEKETLNQQLRILEESIRDKQTRITGIQTTFPDLLDVTAVDERINKLIRDIEVLDENHAEEEKQKIDAATNKYTDVLTTNENKRQSNREMYDVSMRVATSHNEWLESHDTTAKVAGENTLLGTVQSEIDRIETEVVIGPKNYIDTEELYWLNHRKLFIGEVQDGGVAFNETIEMYKKNVEMYMSINLPEWINGKNSVFDKEDSDARERIESETKRIKAEHAAVKYKDGQEAELSEAQELKKLLVELTEATTRVTELRESIRLKTETIENEQANIQAIINASQLNVDNLNISIGQNQLNLVKCGKQIEEMMIELTLLEDAEPIRRIINDLKRRITALDIPNKERMVNDFNITQIGILKSQAILSIKNCETEISDINAQLNVIQEEKEKELDMKRRQRMRDLVEVYSDVKTKGAQETKFRKYNKEYDSAESREAKDKVYEEWQYKKNPDDGGILPVAQYIRNPYVLYMKQMVSLEEMGISDTFNRNEVINNMGIRKYVNLYEGYIASKRDTIIKHFISRHVVLDDEEKTRTSGELIDLWKTRLYEYAVRESIPSFKVRDVMENNFIRPFMDECDVMIGRGESVIKRVEKFKVDVKVEAEYQKMLFLFPAEVLGDKERGNVIEEWNHLLVRTLPWEFHKPTPLPVLWDPNVKRIMEYLRDKSTVNLKFAVKYIDADEVEDIYTSYYKLINKEINGVHVDELLLAHGTENPLKKDCIKEIRFFNVKYTDAEAFMSFMNHKTSPPLPHEYFWYIPPSSSVLTHVGNDVNTAVNKYNKFLALIKKYFNHLDYKSVVVDENYYYHASIYQMRQYEIEELYFELMERGDYYKGGPFNGDKQLCYLFGMLTGMDDVPETYAGNFEGKEDIVAWGMVSGDLEKVKHRPIQRPIPFNPDPRVFPIIQSGLKPALPEYIALDFEWYTTWYTDVTSVGLLATLGRLRVVPLSVEELMTRHLIPMLNNIQNGDARVWGCTLYMVFRNIYEVKMRYDLGETPIPPLVDFAKMPGNLYDALRGVGKILPLKKIRGSNMTITCKTIKRGENDIWRWFMHFYNFDNNLSPVNEDMKYPTVWASEISKVKSGGDILSCSTLVDAFEDTGVYCFYQLASILKNKMNERRETFTKARNAAIGEATRVVDSSNDPIHHFISTQRNLVDKSAMVLFYLHRLVVDSYISICQEVFGMDVQKYRDDLKTLVPHDKSMINMNDMCNYKNARHYLPVCMIPSTHAECTVVYNKSVVAEGSIFYNMASVYGTRPSVNFGSIGKKEFREYVIKCYQRVVKGEMRDIIKEDIIAARGVIHNNALNVLCNLVEQYKPIRVNTLDNMSDVNDIFIRMLNTKQQKDLNVFFMCMLLLETKRVEYVYKEFNIPYAMNSNSAFQCQHTSKFGQGNGDDAKRVRDMFEELDMYSLPYIGVPVVKPAGYIKVINDLTMYDMSEFSVEILSCFDDDVSFGDMNCNELIEMVETVKGIVKTGTLSQVLSCIYDIQMMTKDMRYQNLGDILCAMLYTLDWRRFDESAVLWVYHNYMDMFIYNASSCDVLYLYHKDMLKDKMDMNFNKMVELNDDSNIYYHRLFVYTMLKFYVQFKYENEKGFNSALTWEKTRVYLNFVLVVLLNCIDKKKTLVVIITSMESKSWVSSLMARIGVGGQDAGIYKELFTADALKSLESKNEWGKCYKELGVKLPRAPEFDHESKLERYVYYARCPMVEKDDSIFKRESKDDFMVEFLVQSHHILTVFGLTTDMKYVQFLEASTLLFIKDPVARIVGMIDKLNLTVKGGTGKDNIMGNLLKAVKHQPRGEYLTNLVNTLKLINKTKAVAVNDSFFNVVQYVFENIHKDRMAMINTLMTSDTNNLYHFLLCDILNNAKLKVPRLPLYRSLEEVDNVMSIEMKDVFTKYDGLCEVYSSSDVMMVKCRKYILYSLYRMSEVYKGGVLGYVSELPEVNGMDIAMFERCPKGEMTYGANEIILSKDAHIDTVMVVKPPVNLISQLKSIIRDDKYTTYGLHFGRFIQLIDGEKYYDSFEYIGRVCRTHILVGKIKEIMAKFVEKLELTFADALWGCYETLLSEMELFDVTTMQETNIRLNNYYMSSIRFDTSTVVGDDNVFDGLVTYADGITNVKEKSNMLGFLGFFVYEYGELLKRELIKRLFRIENNFNFSQKDMLKQMLENFNAKDDLNVALDKYYTEQKKYYAYYVGAAEIVESKKNSSWVALKFNIYDGRNAAASKSQIKSGFCDAFLRSMSMFETMSSSGKTTKKVYSENKDFVVTLNSMHRTYSNNQEIFSGMLQKYLNSTREVVGDDDVKGKRMEIVKPVTFDVSLTLLARHTSFPVSQTNLYYKGRERQSVEHLMGNIDDYGTIFRQFVEGKETSDAFVNILKNEKDVVKREINITLLCYKFLSLGTMAMERLFKEYVKKVMDKLDDDKEKGVPLQFDVNKWPKLKKSMDEHGGGRQKVLDRQIDKIKIDGSNVESIKKFFKEVSLSETKPFRNHLYIFNLKKRSDLKEKDVDELLDIVPTFCSLAPYYPLLEDAMSSVATPGQDNLDYMADMLTREISSMLFDDLGKIQENLTQMETDRMRYIDDVKSVHIPGRDIEGYDDYKRWVMYYQCEKFKILLVLITIDKLTREQFNENWTDDKKKISGFRNKGIKEIAKSYHDIIEGLVKKEDKQIKPTGTESDDFPKPADETVEFPGNFGAEISFTGNKHKRVMLYKNDRFMEVIKYAMDKIDDEQPNELISQLDANYGNVYNPWVYVLRCVIARRSKSAKSGDELTRGFISDIAAMLKMSEHVKTLGKDIISNEEYKKIFNDMLRALREKGGTSEITEEEKKAINDMFQNEVGLRVVERALKDDNSAMFPHRELLKEVCVHVHKLYTKWAQDKTDAQKFRQMNEMIARIHKV